MRKRHKKIAPFIKILMVKASLFYFVLFLGILSSCAPAHNENRRYSDIYNHQPIHQTNYRQNRNNSIRAAQQTGSAIGTILGGGIVHPAYYNRVLFFNYNLMMNNLINSLIVP